MGATLADIETGPIKALLYGAAGSGKTAFGTTYGKGTMVLDFDRGLHTARTMKDKWSETRKLVEPKFFHETEPGRAVAWARGREFLASLAKEIVAKKPGSPKFLIVDSLTTMAEAAVNFIMGNSGRLGQAPEIQHWGLAFLEIENLLRSLRSLPIGVLLIAHAQTKEIDEKQYLEIAISGKNLPNKIPAFFDEVWFAKTVNQAGGKVGFVLQTVKSPFVLARSRGNIPDNFDMNLGIRAAITAGGYTVLPDDPTTPTTPTTPVPAQPTMTVTPTSLGVKVHV